MSQLSRRCRRAAVPACLAMATVLAISGCSFFTGSGGGNDSSTVLRVFVHSNAPTDAAFEKINAMFEEQNPGVTVEMTSAVGADFETVRNTRVAAKSVDITEGSTQGGTLVLPEWVAGQQPNTWVQGLEVGNWVDLTDEPFMANFSPGVLESYAYEGRQYAVPTGTSEVSGVFYNKAMFAEHGLEVPTTWQEMLNVIEVLKGADEQPFIMGGKDSWPAAMPVWGLVQSLYPDMEAVDRGLWEGTMRLDDPKSIELMTRLQTIYDNTAPGWSGIDYATVPSRFVAGEGAMLPDGSWEIPAIQKADPNFEFGYFPMPGSDDAEDNKYISSKLEFSLSIPSSSTNQELAKEWLALYSDPDVYSDFVTAAGFGPAQPDVDLPTVAADYQQYMPPSGFMPTWEMIWHPNTAAGPLAITPFAYSAVAPMGTDSDMTALAKKMNEDWEAGLES